MTAVAQSNRNQPRILGIDAGGTMTDAFIINDKGEFIVGKAQSTPEDESVAVINSAVDGLNQWDIELNEGIKQLKSGIFSGTAMLNRLLERKGQRVGILVSGGMEDYLRMERAIQTYLGYGYSDRVHTVTHIHNEPLVPKERIFGVRGRVNVFGQEVIPLYEEEVKAAAQSFVDLGVDSVVVNLIFSYKNSSHEDRSAEIMQDVFEKQNASHIKIFRSSDLYPMRQDFPRLNSTLMEAYAAEPSRTTLKNVQQRLKEEGGQFDLRVMASHGGSISMEAKELARTMISGPIGGVIGAKYLGDKLGISNIACTDIGGTSFDLALITDGEFAIKQNPDIARFVLNMPLVRIDSVGAGTGSFVRINPASKRIEYGPDSAGSRIGVCWPESGLDTVTITDCNVVLGYINPDFFLGGSVQLNRERAIEKVTEQVAKPLGIDVYQAANGVIEIFEDGLKNDMMGQILGKGYGPENYTLLCYGGGGPLHVAGYSSGLDFEDILVPAWAPGFSAFGCACGDYEYRFDRQIDQPIVPAQTEEQRNAVAEEINSNWARVADQVRDEFARSGVEAQDLQIKYGVRMLYNGQLNDLEFISPVETISGPEDFEKLVNAFEDLYGKTYGLSARTPEFGHVVTSIFARGVTDVEKPVLPEEAEAGADDWKDAIKGERQIFWRGEWYSATIIDLEKLRSGNVIKGPAVVESPSSTMVVTPEREARFDKHRIFHLSTGK